MNKVILLASISCWQSHRKGLHMWGLNVNDKYSWHDEQTFPINTQRKKRTFQLEFKSVSRWGQPTLLSLYLLSKGLKRISIWTFKTDWKIVAPRHHFVPDNTKAENFIFSVKNIFVGSDHLSPHGHSCTHRRWQNNIKKFLLWMVSWCCCSLTSLEDGPTIISIQFNSKSHLTLRCWVFSFCYLCWSDSKLKVTFTCLCAWYDTEEHCTVIAKWNVILV